MGRDEQRSALVEGTDDLAAAAFALIAAPIRPACAPGVKANLAVIARHLAIVRSAAVLDTTEAAEIFRP